MQTGLSFLGSLRTACNQTLGWVSHATATGLGRVWSWIGPTHSTPVQITLRIVTETFQQPYPATAPAVPQNHEERTAILRQEHHPVPASTPVRIPTSSDSNGVFKSRRKFVNRTITAPVELSSRTSTETLQQQREESEQSRSLSQTSVVHLDTVTAPILQHSHEEGTAVLQPELPLISASIPTSPNSNSVLEPLKRKEKAKMKFKEIDQRRNKILNNFLKYLERESIEKRNEILNNPLKYRGSQIQRRNKILNNFLKYLRRQSIERRNKILTNLLNYMINLVMPKQNLATPEQNLCKRLFKKLLTQKNSKSQNN